MQRGGQTGKKRGARIVTHSTDRSAKTMERLRCSLTFSRQVSPSSRRRLTISGRFSLFLVSKNSMARTAPLPFILFNKPLLRLRRGLLRPMLRQKQRKRPMFMRFVTMLRQKHSPPPCPPVSDVRALRLEVRRSMFDVRCSMFRAVACN